MTFLLAPFWQICGFWSGFGVIGVEISDRQKHCLVTRKKRSVSPIQELVCVFSACVVELLVHSTIPSFFHVSFRMGLQMGFL